MSAPELSSKDVEREAQGFYGANRRHHLLAFYGTGREDQVRVGKQELEVAVIPVDSELRLRERLLDLESDARAIFLVPWNGTLPLDLSGRFAKFGRILRVGREARIRTLFGAGGSEGEVRDSPLAGYLLKHHGDQSFSASGGHLTLDAMWSSWLERVWGLPKGEIALDSLLGFAALDGRGPSFVSTLQEREAGGVRDALLEHLEERLGACGPLVWKAWESGEGRKLLHLSILSSALQGNNDAAVSMGLSMLAQQLGGAEALPAILPRLASVCDPALRFVKQRTDAREARKLLREADEQVTVVELRPHLRASNLLPSAWRGRLDVLGVALGESARDPSQENLLRTTLAFSQLEAHELFSDAQHGRIIRRAQMAVRLTGWLCTREEVPSAASSYGDVELLANWFATEGGYVDWARKSARGVCEGSFGDGVAALLKVVDGIRQDYDQRFSRTLPAWLESGRHSNQVFSIDEGIKKVASKFLGENEERKLLVLLMDGMAWAQTVEILESLGQQAAVWGPLAWHGVKKNKIGTAPYPAMLANFPTVTEVSRSAFFAGKPMQVGKKLSTSKDPERWEKNREVLKYCDETLKPRLLLKGEGHAKDGSASEEALSLVADMRRRMVGIVINTIDMSLKSDAAERQEWGVDSIKSLRNLLDRARDVGRAVMLVADHGHVPSDRFGQSATKGKEGGARWKAWNKGDAVSADFEVKMDVGPGVWAPRGADGVVLLADDSRRYGGGPGAGEHGGATLAEVVAPCLLIGHEDNEAIGDDPAQSVSPAPMPSWWHFNVRRDLQGSASMRATSKVTASGTGVKGRRKTQPKTQLSLPQMAAPKTEALVAGAVVEAAKDTAAQSAFAKCKMLKARTKSKSDLLKVVKAVEFLLSKNGIAEAAAFEQAMGLFRNRARGEVSWLQEILNVDGYQVLSFERQSKQVRLQMEVLAQQFEVEL